MELVGKVKRLEKELQKFAEQDHLLQRLKEHAIMRSEGGGGQSKMFNVCHRSELLTSNRALEKMNEEADRMVVAMNSQMRCQQQVISVVLFA